jgi:hypothetical protein
MTVAPRSRASATPAIQAVDLPMPAWPSMINARGPSVGPPRNASMRASSASRPMIWAVMRAIFPGPLGPVQPRDAPGLQIRRTSS